MWKYLHSSLSWGKQKELDREKLVQCAGKLLKYFVLEIDMYRRERERERDMYF